MIENKWTVTCETHFEAAHMLSNYEGKCNNLHGHSYKLRVTVTSNCLKEEGDEVDMVIDYGTLKKVVADVVESKLDHALIVSGARYREPAEEKLLEWAHEYMERVHILDGRSTSENMAMEIWQWLSAALDKYTVGVELWETEKNHCSFGRS